MNRATPCIILSAIALIYSPVSLAYMGPTFGLGIVGTVVAVIAVSLISLFAFVVLPVRRLLQKMKKKSAKEDPDLQQ